MIVFSQKEYGLVVVVLGALLLASCLGSRNTASVPTVQVVNNESNEANTSPQATVGVKSGPASPLAQPDIDPAATVLYEQREAFIEPFSQYDVLHTALDLSFDFTNKQVIGTASHRVQVTATSLNVLRFHGTDMVIQRVRIKSARADTLEVAFQYTDELRISLPTQAERGEMIEVFIDYVANPMRNGRNLGLVFVDPRDVDPSRPTQIWTLGQPEDNRYWFPGWDYPNDRMTFDLSLTVPQQFTTIANGQLVERTEHVNGLRTDLWSLQRPHASYLTGFIVGEYAVATEAYTRRDGSAVPLAYFVEHDHLDEVPVTYGETRNMMRFFEDRLGVAYPWANYKQTTVRDFTANGMENTTATVMYEHLVHDRRAHLDYTGRDLITHELAHQWFGNLLTSRNWANLPLNEGFASYFERLYLEDAHGMDAAQHHTISDRDRYFTQAKTLQRPVIWYGYKDPNELYDRHTYQKAALVIHQLRNEVGDNTWWRGVRRYVRDNAFREVVVEDLQRAMEEESGRSMDGFFNQWFRRPGHPELLVRHEYDRNRGLYEIHVTQQQDSLLIGDFGFHVDIEVNMVAAASWSQRYRVASRDTTFRFGIAGNVSFVRFDAGDWLLADIKEEKSISEWINQLQLDDEMAGRYDAAMALLGMEPESQIRDILTTTLKNDPSEYVRRAIADGLQKYSESIGVRTALADVVSSDRDAAVRRLALTSLSDARDVYVSGALDAAISDSSYAVIAKAVEIYASKYPERTNEKLRSLFDLESWKNEVEMAMIKAYKSVASVEGIPYLQKHLGFHYHETLQVESIQALTAIAQQHNEVRVSIAEAVVPSLGSVHEPVRFAAAVALQTMRVTRQRASMEPYLQQESSGRVKAILEQLVNP